MVDSFNGYVPENPSIEPADWEMFTLPPELQGQDLMERTVLQIPANNWQPRPYQHNLWKYMEGGGKRAVAVWHRRAGKDLFSINRIAKSMIQRPGLYWHLFPTYAQGRKVIWDGFTKDGLKFTQAFPEQLVKMKSNQMMKIELHNGAIYQVVGCDDPDALVGANPFGIVFSEWSIMHPKAWTLMRPILRENGGWAIFIFTPRGKNHGFELLERAKSRDSWFSECLGVRDTERLMRHYANMQDTEEKRIYWVGQIPVTQAGIDEEKEDGMSQEMIDQEFHVDFNAPLVGSYYGAYIRKAEDEDRIRKSIEFDPLLPVDTAWDLGVDDQTSIWFIQQYYNEIRWIDFYYNSGEGLPHYANLVKQKLDGFTGGRNYFPHDVEARSLESGKTRSQILKSLGIKVTLVRRQHVADGIEAVRSILPRSYFCATKCKLGLQALKEYSKKWDEKAKTFLTTPVHDWTSHPADAARTYAMGFKDLGRGRRDPKKEREMDNAQGGWNPYSS